MLFVKVPPRCGRYFAVPALCRAPRKQQGPGQREKRGPGERRLSPGREPEQMLHTVQDLHCLLQTAQHTIGVPGVII